MITQAPHLSNLLRRNPTLPSLYELSVNKLAQSLIYSSMTTVEDYPAAATKLQKWVDMWNEVAKVKLRDFVGKNNLIKSWNDDIYASIKRHLKEILDFLLCHTCSSVSTAYLINNLPKFVSFTPYGTINRRTSYMRLRSVLSDEETFLLAIKYCCPKVIVSVWPKVERTIFITGYIQSAIVDIWIEACRHDRQPTMYPSLMRISAGFGLFHSVQYFWKDIHYDYRINITEQFISNTAELGMDVHFAHVWIMMFFLTSFSIIDQITLFIRFSTQIFQILMIYPQWTQVFLETLKKACEWKCLLNADYFIVLDNLLKMTEWCQNYENREKLFVTAWLETSDIANLENKNAKDLLKYLINWFKNGYVKLVKMIAHSVYFNNNRDTLLNDHGAIVCYSLYQHRCIGRLPRLLNALHFTPEEKQTVCAKVKEYLSTRSIL